MEEQFDNTKNRMKKMDTDSVEQTPGDTRNSADRK